MNNKETLQGRKCAKMVSLVLVASQSQSQSQRPARLQSRRRLKSNPLTVALILLFKRLQLLLQAFVLVTMARSTDVIFSGWVSKKKGSGLLAFFKGTKKRYGKLKSTGYLEFYDKEEGGQLLTNVKVAEVDQPYEDPWVHVWGYNDVKSKDTYIRIQGDPEVPGDTEEWLENIQSLFTKRTDQDIHEAAKAWIEDRDAAERRFGHIRDWDVSQVTNMKELFRITNEEKMGFNEDLSKWDVSNVANMFRMFQNCRELNLSDLSKWNTRNVTNMSQMFHGAWAFKSDLSKWDTSKVTNMSMMFFGCRAFTSDLSKWNVGKVENMMKMFLSAEKFTSDLSQWDVGKVTDMTRMFDNAEALKEKPSWYKS